jgi:hypothetical protein
MQKHESPITHERLEFRTNLERQKVLNTRDLFLNIPYEAMATFSFKSPCPIQEARRIIDKSLQLLRNKKVRLAGTGLIISDKTKIHAHVLLKSYQFEGGKRLTDLMGGRHCLAVSTPKTDLVVTKNPDPHEILSGYITNNGNMNLYSHLDRYFDFFYYKKNLLNRERKVL